jgi:2,3-bisphosphoglycerate-independent phosphoglycerate mutase
MGNSEVGHLNLGAGRVVAQDMVRISQSIASGEFFRLPPLVELCEQTRRHGGTLHLMGLIGTGGVHALDKHLLAAVDMGHRAGVPVAIHAWLDGRDTLPQSGLAFMRDLLQQIAGRAVVSTVIGRYYAMDRDKRWDRTKLAYDAMVRGVGQPAPDPVTAIQQAYAAGETDEFIKPRIITGAPLIKDGDGVFCFNFRADRMRRRSSPSAARRCFGPRKPRSTRTSRTSSTAALSRHTRAKSGCSCRRRRSRPMT